MDAQRAGQSGKEHNHEEHNHNESAEEARRLRRLQVMMSMVMSVISQDPDLTLEEAAEMAANARRAALSMFPDKEWLKFFLKPMTGLFAWYSRDFPNIQT